jgi:hypothetical protein
MKLLEKYFSFTGIKVIKEMLVFPVVTGKDVPVLN